MQRPATIVPPLTPFTADLRVDFDLLAKGVDYVVEDCNATVVIAAGVEAQEYQYLTLEARKELIRKTIELVDKRRPVTVGVSHPSFRISIELAEYADSLGAQSIQLLAPQRPIGGPPTTAELVAYFEAVGRQTKLPMMLYLNAGPGADVSIPATIELSKLDCVHYVKESSRDLSRVARLIAEIELAGHAHYYVTMQMLLASLMIGGTGVTLPPPGAKIADGIIDAFMKGDFQRASELQKQFSLFPARWMPFGLAPVMKAALDYLGVPCGLPYPPYRPLEGADLKALQNHLASMDFADRTPKDQTRKLAAC
jgi:4-hydroxy-tetrahydrodipicolinate synthase